MYSCILTQKHAGLVKQLSHLQGESEVKIWQQIVLRMCCSNWRKGKYDLCVKHDKTCIYIYTCVYINWNGPFSEHFPPSILAQPG